MNLNDLKAKLRELMPGGWEQDRTMWGSVVTEPDYDTPDTVGAGTPIGTDRRGRPVTAGEAQAVREGYNASGLGTLVDNRGEETFGGVFNPGLSERLRASLQGVGEAASGVLQMRGGLGKPRVPKNVPSMFEMLGDKEVPRLTKDEANQLALRAKTDPRALEELVERMQPWVASVVQKHARKGSTERYDVDLMNDLMQEFNRRIPRWVEKYDPTRTRPVKDAAGNVTQQPYDFFTYVGNPKNDLMLALYKRRRQAPVGMSGPRDMRKEVMVNELDAPVPTRDDEDLSLHEILEDVRQNTLRASGDLKVDAQAKFNQLKPRAKSLLEMRLGIGEEEGMMTLEQMAARLGISKQAIQKQLEAAERALAQLLGDTELGQQAQQIAKKKPGGRGPAKPLNPNQQRPPISGGADIDPELQAYNRAWEQAYQNYREAVKGSNKHVFGGPGDEAARHYLEDIQDRDYINLPPRRGAPLSPDQAAKVDQLGVGRLKMPPVEPDPEIVRQLRAPQNLSDHMIPYPASATGETPWYTLSRSTQQPFNADLSQADFERLWSDNWSMEDINSILRERLIGSTEGSYPGMPMLKSTPDHPARDIFALKSEWWLPKNVDWYVHDDVLRNLKEKGLWP